MARLVSILQAGRSLVTGAVVAPLRGGDRIRALPAGGPWTEADEARIGAVADGAGIAALGALLREGALSAEELALHHLARIRRRNPALGAVISLNPDALEDARAADARLRAGAALGPLDGITVTLKDNVATAGPMPTTAGAAVLAGHVAAQDADLVTALRAGGAVILGKANLSELAGAIARTAGVSAVGGRTVNPFGRRFSPGGSSSGSAVGVAAGLGVASVGTETSGSLIAPASFNGVVAVKPSRGVVPGAGVVPLVRHQDVPGPVARCVADAAEVLAVMTAGAVRVELSADALRDVTVGVLRADVLAQRSPLEDTRDNDEILARIDRGLSAAGARIVDVALGEAADYERGFTEVLLGGLAHDTMGHLAGAGAPASTVPALHAWNLRRPRSRMPWGQLILTVALVRAVDREAYEEAALRYRALGSELLEAAFRESGAVMLVSVSNRHSAVYATGGYPAVSVPLGLRANGMPVGATLIGRFGDDARLIGCAHALESATRLRVAPPQVVAAA